MLSFVKRTMTRVKAYSQLPPPYLAMKMAGRLSFVRNFVRSSQRLSAQRIVNVQSDGFFSFKSAENFFQAMERDGISFDVKVDPQLIEAIEAFSGSTECYGNFDTSNAGFVKDGKFLGKDRSCLIAHYANLRKVPLFQRVENSEVLQNLAEVYLGGRAKPIAVQLWWSFVNNASDEDRSKVAQFFHRDLDSYNFAKFFVYLTDVEPADGSHVFVKGSHKTSFKSNCQELFLINRVSDEKINRRFDSSCLIDVNGPKGTAFFEDTYGFHKGNPPTENARLVLCLVYSDRDYGVQNFEFPG